MKAEDKLFGNTAFIFPGVGSQYVGMGKGFYDNFPVVRNTFEEASEVIRQDLSDLCFSGKESELSKLENAQLTILTLSVATWKVYMQEIGIIPKYCLGHSLGEYSALCCAGVLSFSDCLELVRERGLIIKSVAEKLDGMMAWVINLDIKKVEDICKNESKPGREIHISAYDCIDQSSVSGYKKTVMQAAKKLEQEGAIVYPLKLSGPFHSPLMKEAEKKMKTVLKHYKFRQPKYTVIANQNALPYADSKSTIDNLSLQLVSPIRWQESVDYIVSRGTTLAVEMGPKNVLKFLLEKNSKTVQTYSLENENDLKILKGKMLLGGNEFLKVIANCLRIAVSTKNYSDSAQYERKVVLPFRKIEHLYENLKAKDELATEQDMIEAVEMLEQVLAAKKIPKSEQYNQLNQLLNY